MITRPRRRSSAAAALVATLALAGCAPEGLNSGAGDGVLNTPDTGRASTAPASATPTVDASEQPIVAACLPDAQRLPLADRVGQLYMVGVSTKGVDADVRSAVSTSKVGSVVLLENSTAGAISAASVSAAVGALGSSELPILVAVDQEGGRVQRLQGPGFTPIPPATQQGQMPTDELRAGAQTWGEELAGAGVHYNLAPVADVVPTGKLATNAPIGVLKRNFGVDSDTVSRGVVAFIEGMQDASVATSVKHFPGLGEVTNNTDHGIAIDTDVVADDPGWQPFVQAISAGVSSVMVSSAVYKNLDPASEAVFSEKIITGILRGELGFDRVVISDDLGAAAAVRNVPVAERGTRFLTAGGDLVINANPRTVGAMISHTVAAAEADPSLEAQLTDSAARVLSLKESVGIYQCS